MKNSSPASSTMFRRQQRRRIGRFQPLHRVEGDLQHQIEQRGQPDDGDAGYHRDVEFEPLHHDEDGGELAQHRQPAQPQDRIQTDIAARMAEIGGGDISVISGSLAACRASITNSLVGDCCFRRHGRACAGHPRCFIAQTVRLPGTSPGMTSACAWPAMAAMNGPHDEVTMQSHGPACPRPIRAGSAAIEVARLVKLYKTTRAVDDVSFRIRARQHHRTARRQRRRQDHDHRHDHGAGAADLGAPSRCWGIRCPSRAPRCSAG